VRRGGGESGATDALGIALLAPAMIGLALVIVFLGRSVDGRATVHGAAESAAQAAARERTPAGAVAAARRVGSTMLVDDRSCAAPLVAVDVSDFRPGGVVAVTVRCSTSTAGVEVVAPRRTMRSSATAYAVVDRFRRVGEDS
jgi:Flp pilus assembly protein TadG